MANTTKKNQKSTLVRVLCLALAGLMIFSVLAAAIWQ